MRGNRSEASKMTSKLAMAVVALLFFPSPLMASEEVTRAGEVPTPMELQALVRTSWDSFSRVIYSQDRLVDPPTRLIGLPQALCRKDIAETYECASLVEYELSNGIRRSALLRHNVERNEQGKLVDVIVFRETPTSQSTQGVR